MLIKTGRLNKQNNKNMNTSKEKKEKRKLSTCADYVQVHIQSIINLVYISLVYLRYVFLHWITNQQQF